MAKQVATQDPGPAELYEQKELSEQIQQLIDTLAPDFRMALVLRDIEGYSYEEISQYMESVSYTHLFCIWQRVFDVQNICYGATLLN